MRDPKKKMGVKISDRTLGDISKCLVPIQLFFLLYFCNYISLTISICSVRSFKRIYTILESFSFIDDLECHTRL